MPWPCQLLSLASSSSRRAQSQPLPRCALALVLLLSAVVSLQLGYQFGEAGTNLVLFISGFPGCSALLGTQQAAIWYLRKVFVGA